jgi:hypothetical protein
LKEIKGVYEDADDITMNPYGNTASAKNVNN